jgi:excisionase family DNA binding protein
MAAVENYLTIAEAAKRLGLSAWGVRTAIQEKRIKAVSLDETSRTKLIPREEVERYRREHLGQRGKRPQPEGLTEQQRKQRAYQQAYYQRRKAARAQQPAPSSEPAREDAEHRLQG